MREQEYLAGIRSAKGLPRAVLSEITLDKTKKTACFCLVTDVTYSKEDVEQAVAVSQNFLPDGWKAEVAISKFVADEQAVKQAILKSLAAHSPMVAAFLAQENIGVQQSGTTFQFCLYIGENELKMLHPKEIVDEVCLDLNRTLCGTYTGAVQADNSAAVTVEEEESSEEEEEEILPTRIFPIEEFTPIDGADPVPKHAVYISDCNRESENLTVCGKIVSVRERTTAKGKPFFVYLLSDSTENLRVTYFTKQATIEKVRALAVGDFIVCTGVNELRGSDLSYTAKRINRGHPPEGYTFEKRPMRAAPNAYHTVFPEKFEDFSQTNFFDQTSLPEDLTKNEFVVFDLETTGLNNIPTGGMMDSIIEIGAVKIKDGVMKEKFSTFVGFDKKLPADIVKLTGITDDMLVGAPPVEKVIADFYKFCSGALLVGHNVTFDYRFVQFYGEKERYSFEQKRYDTWAIGQELLVLPNYKLNTLADKFGITFNHHRAFDDALATAKIFIELIKMRGSLPQ